MLAGSPAKEHRTITRTAFRIIAWLAFGAIVFFTLSNIHSRPQLDEGGGNIERAVAYLAVGGLFGIAYPRQPLFALFVVLFAAIGLEFAQLLTPDRHARAIDAAVKAGSGALGVGAGVWIAQVADWGASRPWKR